MSETTSSTSLHNGIDLSTILGWCFRVVLAGVFIYAGTTKMLNPGVFAGSIATFEILPESWSNVLALSLPPFEILAGLLLLTRRGVAVGALSIIFLNIVFLIALGAALFRGLPVDCGCFGSSGPSSPGRLSLAISRDILFLGMSVWIYWKRVIVEHASPIG